MPSPTTNSFTAKCHKRPYAALDPTQALHSAKGKVIVITAGHTGIGYAIAQNFAIAGADHIVLLGRRAEVLQSAAQRLSKESSATKFHQFSVSITDHNGLDDVFLQIRASIGEPDVLVTSAAHFANPTSALDTNLEELLESLKTNALGSIALVQRFATSGSREKIILDVSSCVVHDYIPTRSTYSISKLAFTQWLWRVHHDGAFPNLRVHSFHPGGIYTEAARSAGIKEDAFDWDDVQLPGKFAVWLASKKAAFLDGRFVWAAWDVVEMMERKEEILADEKLLTINLLNNAHN